MKKLIAICLLLGNVQYAYAETVHHHIPVPPLLEGGTVTVTLKDGTSYHFSSDHYAVVPRDQTEDLPNSPVIEKVVKPNTVRVYGGAGPSGLRTTNNGDSITIRQGYDVVYGVGYGRKLSNEVSLDSVMLLNRDGIQGGMLGVGYSW